MKKSRVILTLLLTAVILVLVSCEKSDSDQTGRGEGKSGENIQGLSEEEIPENAIALKEEHLFWYNQPMERTWEKDYTSEEWKNGKCLNMYVMIPDMEGQEIPVIEDELNHRLHQAGYDFYVRFQGPTIDEMFGEDRLGGQTSDELVRQKRSEGSVIDIWIAKDYVWAAQNSELLELTDFLQNEEGRDVYAHFDTCVWEQLADGEGRLYGIPIEPIATRRCVYSYTPQLMRQLSVDMPDFSGNPAKLEDLFPDLLQKGVLPVELEWMEDALMLSMSGLENYGGIIAVSHDGSEWEAVDLWTEKEAMAFYDRLGEWREKGFLDYTPGLLKQLREAGNRDIEDDTGSGRYPYILFRLEERDTNSWLHSMNVAENIVKNGNGGTMTKYYVPEQPVYISGNGNRVGGTAVIAAQTAYPQECMQFLRILYMDPEIRLLLYKGIEGEHYVWQDDVLMNGSAYGFPMGLGLERDLRFWPAGGWGDFYAEEIADMNRNVSMGLGMEMRYDLSEDTELSEKEAVCRRIIEENRAVFLGYYGKETAERLEEIHDQLVEAGYLELIGAVNAKNLSE